jgi:chemotaxis protein MotB
MADKAVIDEKPPAPPAEDDDEPAGPQIDTEAWMLSFGDLVSLMLVFFVMLFAMSTLEDEEFEAIVSALAQQFNPTAQVKTPQPSMSLDIPKIARVRLYNLDYLRALLQEKLAGDPLAASVALHQHDDRLVISLPSDPLFDDGSARLVPSARDTIGRLGTVIQVVGNPLEVQVHTDPSPVADPAFASNWELTLARAISMANELRAGGYTDGIPAYGLADSRFGELSLALSADERFRRARRVDIVVRGDKPEEGAR